MELLLNLIESKKMHVSQVSLAAVADSFIEHLRHLEQTDGFYIFCHGVAILSCIDDKAARGF